MGGDAPQHRVNDLEADENMAAETLQGMASHGNPPGCFCLVLTALHVPPGRVGTRSGLPAFQS